MKKIFVRTMSILVLVFFWCDLCLGEEKDKDKPAMTKVEILTELKETLEDEDEIFDYIPELKRQKDKEGIEFYTFRVGEQDVKLDDIDKEPLEKILGRVHNQATIIRTDRITRQLETIRRSQHIVTRPPQVPVAPTPPQQVQTPPTLPRTQSPPPTPPKR